MPKKTQKYLNFTKDEIVDDDKKNLLDVVIRCFGFYNGKALEKMTHYEHPWMEARRGKKIDEISNNIISKESIAEYFSKIKEKYNMIDLFDIEKYSEKHFYESIRLS